MCTPNRINHTTLTLLSPYRICEDETDWIQICVSCEKFEFAKYLKDVDYAHPLCTCNIMCNVATSANCHLKIIDDTQFVNFLIVKEHFSKKQNTMRCDNYADSLPTFDVPAWRGIPLVFCTEIVLQIVKQFKQYQMYIWRKGWLQLTYHRVI